MYNQWARVRSIKKQEWDAVAETMEVLEWKRGEYTASSASPISHHPGCGASLFAALRSNRPVLHRSPIIPISLSLSLISRSTLYSSL